MNYIKRQRAKSYLNTMIWFNMYVKYSSEKLNFFKLQISCFSLSCCYPAVIFGAINPIQRAPLFFEERPRRIIKQNVSNYIAAVFKTEFNLSNSCHYHKYHEPFVTLRRTVIKSLRPLIPFDYFLDNIWKNIF